MGSRRKIWGGWIDSTVFLTYNTIDQVEQMMLYPFYTQRFSDSSECPCEPCRGLWCNFYFMGQHDSMIRIFQYVYDSLIYYWEKHDIALHYVFLDYIIWTGYQELEDIKSLIDNVPPNNKRMWELSKRMNHEFSDDEWDKLLQMNDFYKLTYKAKWKETTESGHKTFYGHILSQS